MGDGWFLGAHHPPPTLRDAVPSVTRKKIERDSDRRARAREILPKSNRVDPAGK